MKKINLNKKISLVKESISKFDNLDLAKIKGGARAFRHIPSSPMICKSKCFAVNEQ
jgi:hypothetical protein